MIIRRNCFIISGKKELYFISSFFMWKLKNTKIFFNVEIIREIVLIFMLIRKILKG